MSVALPGAERHLDLDGLGGIFVLRLRGDAQTTATTAQESKCNQFISFS